MLLYFIYCKLLRRQSFILQKFADNVAFSEIQALSEFVIHNIISTKMFPLGDCVLMVGSDLRRFQFDSAVANLLHSTMSLTSCLVNNLTRPQFK
jgi:hypothetical protein